MDDTEVIAELDTELRMFKYKTCRSFTVPSFTFESSVPFSLVLHVDERIKMWRTHTEGYHTQI